MPTDEEARGAAAGESRGRSGPRHAAFRKSFLARVQVPAGKAIALAAMPTAVLMGMGFTPALARADDKATTKSLTLEEYQACLEVLEEGEAAEDGTAGPDDGAAATPSPSATPSAPASGGEEGNSPSDGSSSDGTSGGDSSDGDSSGGGTSDNGSSGGDSSSDSGSDDESGSTPSPAPSTSPPAGSAQSGAGVDIPVLSDIGDALGDLGDTIEDVLTPGGKESASATPTPTASSSATAGDETAEGKQEKATGTANDTAGKADEPSEDTADDATGPAAGSEEDATEPAGEDTASPSASPGPSESSAVDPDDCPVATDDEGGVEEGLPALPDDPWYLDASSLLLKGAKYEGIVQVRTADGSVKKVLKYVVSGGTDIGDLHQTVRDKQTGKLHHVQAGKGTTSTIRDGDTVMYTESISGKLLGLIPITFDPENPPPLDIPIIYFTDVRVVQAGQFGGTLHIPGLQQYMTD